MDQCIFCGAVGKLTREHIWADWLKNYIPKNKPHYRTSRQTVWPGGRITDHGGRRVGGDIKSRRVKCVCGSRTHGAASGREGCNDGWMGELQERAKPIVVKLIEGKKTKLKVSDQKTIAAWIAMAVMCSEFGRDETPTIPQSHRTRLYKKGMPPLKHWKIWLGDYQRDKWIPEWGRNVLAVTKEETSKTAFTMRPPLNTQSTTYTVGRLYIHSISSALYAPVRDFDFPAADRHFIDRIWPPRSKSIGWPPGATMLDQDAVRISHTFFEWLRSIGESR